MEFSSRYYEGVGRRKVATARVRLYPGKGIIVVNDRPIEDYFPRKRDLLHLLEPLKATGTMAKFDISVKVKGGGISGQAGAIRHGIARALVKADPNLRRILRKGGFLTRDPRVKERKKPGLKRARKAPQYCKR
jgi:small subunit ribosomal protein S9